MGYGPFPATDLGFWIENDRVGGPYYGQIDVGLFLENKRPRMGRVYN